MQAFQIDVFPRDGAWLIRVGEQVMSGAAARAPAERIARIAADCMRNAGATVRLSVAAGEGASACVEVLQPQLKAAA